MSRNEKMKFIRIIEGSELCISDALAKYDVPRSTYYRWKRKLRNQGIKSLHDNKPYRARTWSHLPLTSTPILGPLINPSNSPATASITNAATYNVIDI